MKITRFELLWGPFIYLRSSFQTDAQNHAKWHQNASQISAKWPWKNTDSDVALPTWGVQTPQNPSTSETFHWVETFQSLSPAVVQVSLRPPRFRCRNGQKRTQSTELRTCMKTCSFLSFPCCVAQTTNFQIIQSHREFITNARREAGQFGVYLQRSHM